MNKDLTRYNTRMFAEHVAPRLRDIHAGWQDHWRPQPMHAAQRAEVPGFSPRGKLAAE